MRPETLPLPIVGVRGLQLRTVSAQAISQVEIAASKYQNGRHPDAAALHAFFTVCAQAAAALMAEQAAEALQLPPALAARWAPAYTFERSADGVYSCDFNPVALIPVPNRTLFVDPNSGSNSNDGLTRATAVATLGNAMGKAQSGDQIRIINMTADIVARSTAGWLAAPGFVGTIAVINESTEFRYFVAGAASTVSSFTANATHAHVMQTAQATAPACVVDVTVKHYPFYQVAAGQGYAVNDTVTLSNGAILTATGTDNGALRHWAVTRLGTQLVAGAVTQTATSGAGSGARFMSVSNVPSVVGTARRVGSLAEVAAQRGTWHNDGTNTYWNPLDGRVATGAQPMVVLGSASVMAATAHTGDRQYTQYFEGIDFIAGQAGFGQDFTPAGFRPIMVFNRCGFQGTRGNGVNTLCNSEFYFYRTGNYYNGADGYNFHNKGGPSVAGSSPRVVVYEVVAQGNGTTNTTSSGTSDNDYTLHEDAIIYMVNSIACGSDDRVFANIDTSLALVLGGFIGSSKSGTGVDGGSSVSLSNSAQAWLDGTVVAPGAGQAEAYRINTGSTLYHRNITPVPTTTGNGAILAYGVI